MLFRKPAVGREISAYCGRCKLERTHFIAAMEGETVRKVTCTMCNTTHNFRGKPAPDPKPLTSARSSPARAGGRAKQATPFSIPQGQPVKAYNMGSFFTEGDIIDHPKFGLGAVETALAPNKIEVRFQEGKKILLHNMGGG